MDLAARELRDIGRSVFITLGKDGCLIVRGRESTAVPGFPAEALDTNGAGDVFAGACLFGACTGMTAEASAAFGTFAAAALIQSYGARFRRLQDYGRVLERFNEGARVADARG
jgi:sugar/nucleoside kinase (ribokinase family)